MRHWSLRKDDESKLKVIGLYLACLVFISITLIFWMSKIQNFNDPTDSESVSSFPEYREIIDKEPVVSRDDLLASFLIQNSGLTVEGSIELIDAIDDDRLKLLVLKEVLRSQDSDHNAYQLGISYGLDGSQIDELRDRYRDRGVMK